MSYIERAETKSIDRTVLVDRDLPRTWICPHCKKRNKMSIYAEETWFNFFKHLQHCDYCSYVHIWELKLTDEFKKQVVDMLLSECDRKEKDQ